MNLTMAGTSRCDVPACEAAGGTIALLNAARMAQRASLPGSGVQSAKFRLGEFSPRLAGRGCGKRTAVMNTNSPAGAVSQLCPKCGLCCNGVLFADVELRKGDDAQRLAELGLWLEKKGRQQAFAQPCAGFDGKLCGIYAERPKRCRTFECGLLKRVQAGGLGAAVALEIIAQTKQQVEKVCELLHCTGSDDQRLALSQRYRRAMSEPVDLSGGKASTGLPGKLMANYHDLMQTLQRDFLK